MNTCQDRLGTNAGKVEKERRVSAGIGASMSARDQARVGQLWLNEGAWPGAGQLLEPGTSGPPPTPSPLFASVSEMVLVRSLSWQIIIALCFQKPQQTRFPFLFFSFSGYTRRAGTTFVPTPWPWPAFPGYGYTLWTLPEVQRKKKPNSCPFLNERLNFKTNLANYASVVSVCCCFDICRMKSIPPPSLSKGSTLR